MSDYSKSSDYPLKVRPLVDDWALRPRRGAGPAPKAVRRAILSKELIVRLRPLCRRRTQDNAEVELEHHCQMRFLLHSLTHATFRSRLRNQN